MNEALTRDKPIGVIGGGLGGLAAACTLAARGHRVLLFEANAWLGGKAAVLEAEGFRFDMGPTILTVPKVLRRIFAEAGRALEDELDLVRLDPQWRCFFEDGAVLDLHENTDRMADALTAFSPDTPSAEGYRRFMKMSERMHDVSERYFFWRPVGSLRDTFDAGNTFKTSTLSDVLSLRMGRTVAGTIRSHVPDARVAQMLDHFTQYVGSSPYNAPAVLCSIAHMQTDGGVWYPIGGTRAVPAALERLAMRLGVEIHTGCAIERIELDGRRVRGVVTADGQRIELKAVVSNMDSVRTHRELIGGRPVKRFLRRSRAEPACSGVVLFLGLRRTYGQLLHHNFIFSRDPHEEFDWIYRRGEPAPDPTCYVCCPARSEPSVAPMFDGERGEALYVLVHTPYLRPHHDWRQMLGDYRRTILQKLVWVAGVDDIEQRIVFESALTPMDIHQRYRVLDGAIYGLASHGRFMGAFKPGNRSRDIDGLYLAGGSAHPGPGMPMALMSGWIAADTLDSDDMGAIRTPTDSHAASKPSA